MFITIYNKKIAFYESLLNLINVNDKLKLGKQKLQRKGSHMMKQHLVWKKGRQNVSYKIEKKIHIIIQSSIHTHFQIWMSGIFDLIWFFMYYASFNTLHYFVEFRFTFEGSCTAVKNHQTCALKQSLSIKI